MLEGGLLFNVFYAAFLCGLFDVSMCFFLHFPGIWSIIYQMFFRGVFQRAGRPFEEPRLFSRAVGGGVLDAPRKLYEPINGPSRTPAPTDGRPLNSDKESFKDNLR